MSEMEKVVVLAVLGLIFWEALKRDWEGVALVFGFVLLVGSCQMLGVH